MLDFIERKQLGWTSFSIMVTAKRLDVLLLLAVLVTGTATRAESSEQPAVVPSHVFPRPLEEVFTQATALLVLKGFEVQRSGDQLVTNWVRNPNSAVAYRVSGARVDDEHCSIRLELLLATPFNKSMERDRAGFAPSYCGGKGAYACNASGAPADFQRDRGDELAAGTSAPPGMVTHDHQRDAALELALLQALDPRADADSHAVARSAAELADGGSAAPPRSASSSTPVVCGAEPRGMEAPIAERRLVLLGDIPGTNEIPDFVARLACEAAQKGVPTVVALELLHADQDWVDSYFASRGSAADRAALLQVTRSFNTLSSDGRGSEALLELLERLHSLRDSGLPIRVVAFDEAAATPARQKARAANVERVRRVELDALLVVVVERAQARTALVAGEAPESATMGWFLSSWGLRTLALDVRSPGGQHWSCVAPSGCAPSLVPATAPNTGDTARTVKLFASPDAQGFQGEYSVGPLTASSAPRP